MILKDKVYQALKWTALIALPATGTLYNTLAIIWALPYGDAVLATTTACGLFIGALIGISQHGINKQGEDAKSNEPRGGEGTD